MLKRVLSLVLSLVFIFTLASCDVNNKKNDSDPEATATPESTSEVEGKTILYQVVPEKLSLMMCYVIKTKNNKLIVIDGGIDGHGLEAPAYLLEELQEISGEEHPVIDAWFITHAHYDHYYEFVKMVEQKNDKFTVNNVYFNFPSDEFIAKYEPNGEPYMDRFRAAYNTLFGENAYQEYEGVQVGDIIEVDNVKFEILQVPDEKITANPINNSSLIFRMEVEGQTVLFTGDAGAEAGSKLIREYKDTIQSDMVQMSHHGQAGLQKAHYVKINPKVCLWPIPEWVWANTNKQFRTDETKKWMFEDLQVKHHYISGLYGTEYIEFPFDFDMEPKNNVDYSY
jgi:hypothetical protein